MEFCFLRQHLDIVIFLFSNICKIQVGVFIFKYIRNYVRIYVKSLWALTKKLNATIEPKIYWEILNYFFNNKKIP